MGSVGEIVTPYGMRLVDNPHLDIIEAMNGNFDGSRLVTAGGDHRMAVYERVEATGSWTLSDVWRAHDAEVFDVSLIFQASRYLHGFP